MTDRTDRAALRNAGLLLVQARPASKCARSQCGLGVCPGDVKVHGRHRSRAGCVLPSRQEMFRPAWARPRTC